MNMSEVWNKLYRGAVENAKEMLEEREWIGCAYNSNVDSIVRLNGVDLNSILSTLDKSDIIAGLRNPPGVIRRKEDLLTGLLLCMRNGSGAEWMVESEEVFNWMESSFKGEFKLGGNCAIMARVLGELGAKVVAHIGSPSPLQVELFGNASEKILSPTSKGFKTVKESADATKKSMCHFIFEFRKNDTISLALPATSGGSGEEVITASEDNRFIASYDPVNTAMEISPHFTRLIQENIMDFDVMMVSGYHLLSKQTYRNAIKASVEQMCRWKMQNPELFIHTEVADIRDPEIRRYFFEMLLSRVDSVGMNEDELKDIASMYHLGECSNYIDYPDLAVRIAKIFSLKRVVVHTKHISVAASCGNIERERDGLLFGALTAGVKAAYGGFASMNTVQQVLETVPLSPKGLEIYSELCGKYLLDPDTATGRHAKMRITAVANRVCENPVDTVGLGDCMTAGTLLFLGLPGRHSDDEEEEE